MNSGRNKEIIGGSVFLICSAVYFVMAFSIRQYQDGILSSDFIPKIYGLILMALSVFQILCDIRFRNKDTVEGEESERLKGRSASVVYTFILLFIYVLLLKPIGFVIMSAVFIFVMTLLLYPKGAPKKGRRLVKIAVLALVFSTAIYGLFAWGFALMLPVGILG